jgi:hypothetical protein
VTTVLRAARLKPRQGFPLTLQSVTPGSDFGAGGVGGVKAGALCLFMNLDDELKFMLPGMSLRQLRGARDETIERFKRQAELFPAGTMPEKLIDSRKIPLHPALKGLKPGP